MNNLLCIECGQKEKLFNYLCENCYKKKVKLASFPQKIKLYRCPHCDAIKLDKTWSNNESDLLDILYEYIQFNKLATMTRIEIKNGNFDEKDIYFTLLGKIMGLDFSEENSIEMVVKSNSCDICSKRFGDYHEAIIQIRSNHRNLKKSEIEKSREIVYDSVSNLHEKDREAFITKESIVKSGLDFYISTNHIANVLVNFIIKEFSGTITKSSKLVGRKDGRDIYRMTYLIRIPNYVIGDFILIKNKIYRIERIHRKNVTLKNLKGEKSTLKHGDIENAKILGNNDLLIDAIVISQTEKEVQILDPDNYKTVDILKAKKIDFKEGETIKIIKIEDNIFIYY